MDATRNEDRIPAGCLHEIHSISDVTNESGATELIGLQELKDYLRLEGFTGSETTNVTPEPSINLVLLSGETEVQDDRLIGATITTLAREGTVYSQAIAVGNLKFTFNSETGTIGFLDPGNPSNESIAVSFGFTPSSPTEAFTFDDDLITELQESAINYLEEAGNVSIKDHTYEMVFSNGKGMTELKYSPIGDIISLKDQNGTTLETSQYQIIGNNQKFVRTPRSEFMTITYQTRGLGRSIAKTAVKRMVAYLYRNRGDDSGAKEFADQLVDKFTRKEKIL